jgi:hypothetical protein
MMFTGAWAKGTVTYRFVGEDYVKSKNHAFGTRLTGFLTCAIPAPPGELCQSGDITKWQFVTGKYKINPTDGSLTLDMAFLNPGGSIGNPDYGGWDMELVSHTGAFPEQLDIESVWQPVAAPLNGATVVAYGGVTVASINADPPGVWTRVGPAPPATNDGPPAFRADNQAAVPEPATWGLMVGGMLAVGAALRRFWSKMRDVAGSSARTGPNAPIPRAPTPPAFDCI